MKNKISFLLLLITIISLPNYSQFKNPKYNSGDITNTEGILSPEEVINLIDSSSDIADNYARKLGALQSVKYVLMVNKEDEILLKKYEDKWFELHAELNKISGGEGTPLYRKTNGFYSRYTGDTRFIYIVQRRCVSAEIYNKYLKRLEELNLNSEAAGKQIQQALKEEEELQRYKLETEDTLLLNYWKNMLVYIIPWVGISILLGIWNKKKGNSFLVAFLLSFFLSPIIGLIMVAISQNKNEKLISVSDDEIIAIPVSDSQKVGVNGSHHLYSFTGKVVGSSKNMETQIHGGGGGGGTYHGTGTSGTVSINSTTVIHDQIFLENNSGKERALQLQDFDIACREGHILTAFWAIKKGNNLGPYIAIHNHNTTQTFYNKQALERVFMQSPGVMLLKGARTFGILGILIGLIVSLSSEEFDINGGIKFGLYGAIIGAILGILFQLPNKKEIKHFKSLLNASLLKTSI